MPDASTHTSERPTLAQYPTWHKEHLKEDLEDKSLRVWYEMNVRSARGTLENHAALAGVVAALQSSDIKRALAGHQSSTVVFSDKPFTSLVDKIFRINCNWNTNFPKEPKGKWLTCADVFARIDDLVRTLVVCRFIDGPETICAAIIDALQNRGLVASVSPKATDEGYYAHHIIVKYPFELLGRDGKARTVKTMAEIQVTTQMQDVLRDLTHVYYRQRRTQPQKRRSAARWDFRSPDFRATYLGHSLHLLEGIVAELRATAEEPKSDGELSVKPQGE